MPPSWVAFCTPAKEKEKQQLAAVTVQQQLTYLCEQCR